MTEEDETFYHYCPPEAFISISQSGKIRFSELGNLNDSTEGKLFKNVINKIAEEADTPSKETQSFALEIISSIVERRRGFVFFLSRGQDLLSQWRIYANDATGFAIGFRKSVLAKFAETLSENDTQKSFSDNVIYSSEEQFSILRTNVSKLLAFIDKYYYVKSKNYPMR